MIAALVAGLVAGYGIAMPMGAVATYLMALTARTSLLIGACAALGVATADGLYALVAALGGSALAPVIQPFTVPLRWASVAVLVALAVRGAVTALRRYREQQESGTSRETPIGPTRAYLTLLGITIMNPTTVIYFAALVLANQATATAPGHLEQAVFVLAAFVASASWQLLLAGGGALLGRALSGARARLLTAMASSALIIALAVGLLMDG
ncbi:lysine transporter LysE [Microtetraspora sp. NBRC 13810]|uniref:LysE family transporter n=1 Tax=Microtetraspora sp. NBRC 13810 TaxID=3030990 RepID=UPI0024A1F6AE|nr:LysE family transporter [Microtetraspora sp. NBRC 13810]GLW11104.1 lysine transporter LysE [Microtetraspora sp. NBRC 13810]